MSEQLPKQVDAHRLARQQGRIAGTVPIERLHRLGTYLCDRRGMVQAELQFGVDPGGVAFVRGRAQAELAMICQRCMEPMTQPVKTEFCLGLAASEGLAARLPEIYEPLLVDDSPVDTWTVVEDELILALPIVPRHEPEACAAQVAQEPGPEAQREHPFAALAQLKNRGSSD